MRSWMLCIWHKDESKEIDEAHIIPEALGCPENLVLRNGEECKNCNNRLAYIDRALIDSFDVLRFHVGQPTKKGKPPQVTSRPNVFASFDKHGPIIEINFGKSKERTSTGKNLSSGKGRPGAVTGSLTVDGQEALLSLKVPIAHQPLLSRAIHKVALACLVKLISHEHVLNSAYDPVRDFVLRGIGSREVLMLSYGEWSYRHAVGPVYSSRQGDTGVQLVLCGFIFYVDLSAEQGVVPKLKEQVKVHYGDEHLEIAAPSLVAEQDSFVLNMIRIELGKPDDEDRTD